MPRPFPAAGPLSPPIPSVNVGIEANGLAQAGVQIADQRKSGWVDVQLYAAAAGHENLKIISWATSLARKPAYRMGADLSDGLPSTAAGTAARNSILASTIQAAQ